MATYINTNASANGGTAVGRDPDSNQGLRIHGKRKGGIHELLNAHIGQDYIDPKFAKEWPLKFSKLTYTQLFTNIVAFLESNDQLYFQGPYMTSKVAVVCEEYDAPESKLSGDTATAPHWDLTIKLRAVVP